LPYFFGSYFRRVVDVDPDLHGSTLIRVAGSGSGSRRAKNTTNYHKNKKVKNFHVLKCWMFSLEGPRHLL
jgi:hypothetical protein